MGATVGGGSVAMPRWARTKGDVDDAVDGLTSLLQELDGQPSPEDCWMVPGGDRDLPRDALEPSLIALL